MGIMSEDESSQDELFEKEDIDEKQHAKLAAAVAELDSKRRVKPAVRNECGSQISEYHVKGSRKKISINSRELANVLGSKGKFSNVDSKVRKVSKKVVTLPKPLEKHVAEEIKRKVGFEVVKDQLQKWDAIVEAHRVSDQLIFPINAPRLSFQDSNEYFSRFRPKSDIEKELEEIEYEEKVEASQKKSDEFPLSMEEIMQRRKEMAHLRARQSYTEAKLYRQSKIKSKKYHRIKKREKVRQEMKEFETLQKTNPEAALKKLEELEKGRAEERANLRHRSTGKWAKNLAVRAKYDKETRKVLSEQLSISRDLTTKARQEDSSDDDAVEPNPGVLKAALDIAANNPWSLEASAEVNEFLRGFKNYWLNKNEHNSTEPTAKPETAHAASNDSSNSTGGSVFESKASGKWVVSAVVNDKETEKSSELKDDDVFYLADETLAAKAVEKFKPLLGKLKPLAKTGERKRKEIKSSESDLAMKKARWQIDRAEVDVEVGDFNEEGEAPISSSHRINQKESQVVDANSNIDPNKFLKVKPKLVKTPLPDDESGGEDGLDDINVEDQSQVIMEAFADDDVVAEFQEMKKDAEKATEPAVVNVLPGWGQWGGVGIQTNDCRKKRRFLQIGDLPARKDKHKPDIIINENSNAAIKNHMVKEVPFPFKSVDAFEANIRAPVSREWVPERTHRDLIRPAVITRQGAIIEPLSDEVLLRNKPPEKSLFKGKKKSNA